ncbi:hypothetical protein ACFOD4_13770 [Pseudoroseomonas globiformis]|uniref:Uncharacterized protein n=1 Tax=Teichococcus globiformis TaxID=2307229 RepID=A0ABV7G628_9PROT
MIDPAPPAKKPVAPQEAPTRPERQALREEVPSESGEMQTAERQKQVVASSPAFDVRLDGETMRLYSELRDPETDRLLLRLPGGYQPEAEQESGVSTEA